MTEKLRDWETAEDIVFPYIIIQNSAGVEASINVSTYQERTEWLFEKPNSKEYCKLLAIDLNQCREEIGQISLDSLIERFLNISSSFANGKFLC